ncbi:MAG TPA: ATP-binding protein [Rubrivivax sp.]|nr:ATP-binding protein [Rubrivivax sp.]
MTDPAAPALGGEASAPRRALDASIAHIREELRRAGVQMLGVDVLLALVIGIEISPASALLWFAGMQTLQHQRRRAALAPQGAAAADPEAFIRSMQRWWLLLGFGRAAVVALAFLYGQENLEVVVTMVLVGLAAGSVATSGGEVRLMRAWTFPALGTLALAWAAQLDWLGGTLALLVLALARLLIGYVENSGRQGRRLIDYAVELETERDRVRSANAALEEAGALLRIERDRAAAANAGKTRVLASVSHDLRQPLFAMSLNTAALGDTLERIDDPYLARIEAGLRRGLTQCRGLLDQLVDFARLDAGSVEVRWAALELGPYLQALAAPYEAAARAAGLDWQLQLAARPLHAWTDALLLERLLGNLLHNAVKFTPRGTVGLRLLPQAGSVRIEVFDTGPGIPAEHQERVFEEFYQLDNPSRDRSRGIGLGLSIVRRLARLLGIELHLSSTGTQGCCFELLLPASGGPAAACRPADGAADDPAEAMAREAFAAESAAARNGKVVLAIDDEADLLADLDTMLGGRGYRVLTAACADEACRRARQQPPDIVLADFRLRDRQTGAAAVQAVRALLGRCVPALIITGETDAQNLAEADASGLRVLHKPLDGRLLAQAVEEALAGQPPGQA